MLRLPFRRLLPLLALALTLTACDSSDDGGEDGIQPGDANAISQGLAIAGATRIDGAAPAPSAAAAAPDIANGAPSLRVGPSGTATVSFSVGDADDLAGFFLQVTGADGYIDAPLSGFTGGIGTFAFDLPAGVDAGDFEVNYCVYTDDDGDGEADLISNVLSSGIEVAPGAGDAGSAGLGSSTLTIAGESFAGSAYAYLAGDQFFLWMSDGDPSTYTGADSRLFYLVLNAVDGTGSYAIDGSESLAAYVDSRDGAALAFFLATGGSVQIDQLEGRVRGGFDLTGTDLSGSDAGTVSGSFDAVLNVGTAPPIPSTGGTDGGEIPWTQNAVPYRDQVGSRISFSCAAGGAPRTVWGTDVYTDDSSVCTAAVHAGAITVSSGGDITVEILPGQDSYIGSSRNGITSSNWGSWGGSFSIVD